MAAYGAASFPAAGPEDPAALEDEYDLAPEPVQDRVEGLRLAPGRGLLARWGRGDALFLHAAPKGGTAAAAALRPAPGDASVFEYAWGERTPEVRSLLHAWRNHYARLRRQMAERPREQGDALLAELLRASQMYRAELQACVDERHRNACSPERMRQVRAAASVPDRDAERFEREHEQQSELLEIAKFVWHLVEIFYVDPSANITRQLTHWLQSSMPQPEESGDPEAAWDRVARLVVQGHVEEASAAVAANGRDRLAAQSSAEELEVLAEVLANVPTLTNRMWSEDRFRRNFQTWRENCRELREGARLPGVRRVYDVLLGDDEALAGVAGSWHELLVGHLLYVEPDASRENVRWIVDRCVRACVELGKAEEELSPVDELLRAVMEMETHEMIEMVDNLFGLRWFVAHLADLLRYTGDLTPVAVQAGGEEVTVDLGEWHVLRYAADLATSPELWPLAPDYLEACGKAGVEHARVLVQRRPLGTDMDALRALDLCRRFGLDGEARSVCVQRGAAAARLGRYGAAVHWFVRGGDASRVSAVCNRLLAEYMAVPEAERGAGALANIEAVVDNVGDMTATPELAFMAKYRDLCQIRRELAAVLRGGDALAASGDRAHGLRVAAAEILVRLVVSRVAPRRYWLTLLGEAVPLLEGSPGTPLISGRDTQALMAALEEVCVSHMRSYYLPGDGDDRAERVQTVRQALCRNLARAWRC